MGELAPPATSRFRQSHSTPVSPGGSSTSVHIASDQATSSPLSIPSSPRTSTYVRPRSQSSNKLLGRPRGPSLPPPDPSQRAFDALINFLPAGIPDKALLKQTILVTTISRPFLAAATPRPACSTASSYLMTSSLSRQTSRERSPRRSVFGALSIGSSRSSVYLPATSPAAVRETGSVSSLTSSPPLPVPEGAAHLVHLLPPSFSERPSRTHAAARQKLVESIEAFLLSFAYPTPLSLEGIKGAAMDMGGGMARGRPYLMPATTFGEPVSGVTVGPVADGHGGEWTVADVLLCSALDREDEPASGPGKAPARQGIAAAMRPRRAWIAGSANVMLVPAPTPSSLPESFFTPPAPAHMPSLPSPREEPFSPRRASGPLQGSPNLAAQQPRPESHPPLQVPPRAQEKPKGRRLSRNFPGRAGQREKDAACKPSATGLPTPPDSDEGSAVEFESVSEPAPALVPVRASVEKIVPTQTVEIVEKASTVGAPGGRKVRWRFWKVRTRA
ncbi:hypothetical protein CERSUDRAFT_116329 [Gelatoporia subvermispora B]|uniref:Uncharacterized protein n=1 Tax=Ceriporiopsis subvermispora (strain B) TaxID=914234 RepID=M2RB06_CERS8|nr:hypothetical protein CERSUDRAFT_116329 [Gelatoporia subvermispora B]